MTALQRPLRILMVDDSEADRTLVEAAFEHQTIPHDFTAVDSGEAALAILNGPVRDRPDLLLLDLNMPGINGFDVLDRVKTSDRMKHLPVVVLTSSDREEDQLRAYRHYANGYLVKPVNASELKRLMGGLLSFWSVARFASVSQSLG